MRWLNFIANLLVVVWICSWVAEPGWLVLDVIGLISWIGIVCMEFHRDFIKRETSCCT